MDARPRLDTRGDQALTQPGGVGRLDPKRQVMKHSLGFLAGKLHRWFWVRHEHDHLRHPVRASPCPQKFVWELGWRNNLEPEQIAIEMQGPLHIAHPQHDLRETRNEPAHAATADAMAARLTSLARVGTEQPGASNRPRPSVSAIARRASASTSAGGP